MAGLNRGEIEAKSTRASAGRTTSAMTQARLGARCEAPSLDGYIDAAARRSVCVEPRGRRREGQLEVTLRLARSSPRRRCRTMPSPRRSSRPEARSTALGERGGDRRSRGAGRDLARCRSSRTRSRASPSATACSTPSPTWSRSARARRPQAIDAARAARPPLGPLAGVPFAVKNLFDVKGLPTLAGSKINRERRAGRARRDR